jgi:hypothetical protein
MSKRADLIAHVRLALEEAAETDGEVARDIVETVMIHVIKALRTDPAIPVRSLADWELALADASNRATFDLRRLDGLIDPREAVWAIEDFFIDYSAPPVREGQS